MQSNEWAFKFESSLMGPCCFKFLKISCTQSIFIFPCQWLVDVFVWLASCAFWGTVFPTSWFTRCWKAELSSNYLALTSYFLLFGLSLWALFTQKINTQETFSNIMQALCCGNTLWMIPPSLTWMGCKMHVESSCRVSFLCLWKSSHRWLLHEDVEITWPINILTSSVIK